jgi:C-terminal processing protease CtpA/Prc
VGYLRIPHYLFGDQSVNNQVVEEYRAVLEEMEQETVGLVIDQDHNCGGSVWMVEMMVGLFMSKPYAPLQFKRLATHESFLFFKKILDGVPPTSPEYPSWKRVLDLVRDSWHSGLFLTPPLAYWGFDFHEPVNAYTRPVLILADNLSGSGGDAFPALMQGYGRATVLGTRTMGAGGHVFADPPLYWSQITTNITRSLFLRPDGVPVENEGVRPDVPYETTVEDLRSGYVGYRELYTRELLKRVH